MELVDSQGKLIAPKEYLEKSLEEIKGNQGKVEEKNRVRSIVREVFKERDCVVLVRPVENEEELQRVH